MFPYDEIAFAYMAGWMTLPAWGEPMFNVIKSLFKPLPTADLVEVWALRNANRATPDGIVAAAIVQSFAKDFKDWRHEGSELEAAWLKSWPMDNKPYARLVNQKKGIAVNVTFLQKKVKDRKFTTLRQEYYVPNTVIVDGVEISYEESQVIISRFLRIQQQVKQAQQAAATAQANMERNEAAWNLAERLLGMKRNEHGALVPIQTAE